MKEDLRSLFEEQEKGPVTVSELNSEIRSVLESGFSSVWVEGEITNFHSAASGHWYFSLTDGNSLVKAACFRGQNMRIRFRPENGNAVRVRGKISVYSPRGEYQIIVETLEPVGEGALALAFEQIKAKLQAEGLFDEDLKRPLPAFPRRIGVVTSPTGAAVHDILTVLERRARSVSVVIVPTLVQGELAAGQIAKAIEFVNEYSAEAGDDEKIDVLIVGRGGGSAEDLWAFNEEKVARAIRASEIPVISAVGHEVDFSISDLVADVRAATPSAAAEIVAESEAVLVKRVVSARDSIGRTLDYKLIRLRHRLNEAQRSEVFFRIPQNIRDTRLRIREQIREALDILRRQLDTGSRSARDLTHRLSPARLAANLEKRRGRLDSAAQRSLALARKRLAKAEESLKVRAASLDALSPLAVLTRGFSLARDAEGRIVRDASELAVGARVNVKVHRGSFDADVVSIEEES
ncbi:MAG: exodeoxyribonuclease VII large subunit [Aridibacter famidurans]|nr:exodeoxyribonuclease VII large subunit [Aridibacter famidurans]